MIKYANAENPRSLYKLVLRLQINFAWLEITRRMVVSKDDGSGAIGDHVGVDIARMNKTAIQEANCDDAFLDYFVSAVKRNADEMLL